MNDLIQNSTNGLYSSLPDELAGYLRNYEADVSITDWEGFKRRFLMGSGKSKGTYETYLIACRQFYNHTGGLNPVNIAKDGTAIEWIESYYDSLTCDLTTKALKVSSLKFMYRKICDKYPFIKNPFNEMDELLTKKLNKSKTDISERDSLTKKEYHALLKWLRIDKSKSGVLNYAIILFGVTTAMRAAEIVSLTWENICETEGGYSATFIGKGSKARTVHFDAVTYKAIRKAFKARYGRQPAPTDRVFNGLGRGDGMSKVTLHRRIKGIIDGIDKPNKTHIPGAKDHGIVRANVNVSAHSLRHTGLTFDAQVLPLDAVQKKAGHSSLATTQRYLHSRVDWAAVYEKRHEGVA